MAATYLRSRGIIGSITKRFAATQIWSATSRDSLSASALAFRRGAHASVYDKNPDEHVRPAVVPDEVIEPESDKYWAPHPQTGVFGPSTGPHLSADKNPTKTLNAGGEEEGSVLEQKAWFRPTSIEDLEKPNAMKE